MQVLISVITAVFNDEKFIKKSVESILHQSFSEFEYIIVDDGSTDKTLEILKEIEKTDKRVTILTQKNLGAAAARNLGIYSAKGKYIAIQDSDDLSSPERLKIQLEHLLKSDNNLISFTAYEIIDSNDTIISKNNKVYKNINNNILKGSFCACHPTMMVLKESIIKANGYNPFYKKTEDYDLIYKLIENNGFAEKINLCLYSYRLRDNSEGTMNNGAYPKRVYENHLNRIKNKPENFKEVINDFKKDKNVILKRTASAIFYSEDYSQYLKVYLKNFYKLPVNNFLYFFIYSILPPGLKKLIKSIRFV